MNKIKLMALIKGVLTNKTVIIIMSSVLVISAGTAIGVNVYNQNHAEHKIVYADTKEQATGNRGLATATGQPVETPTESRFSIFGKTIDEEDSKPVAEVKQEVTKTEPKQEEAKKEETVAVAKEQVTNTQATAQPKAEPKPTSTAAAQPASQPAPAPAPKPAEPAKPSRASGIDQAKTDEINNKLPYVKMFRKYPDGRTDELIQSSINLAFGGGVLDRIKSEWMPNPQVNPDMKFKYMSHTVNVKQGPNYYYTGFVNPPDGFNSGFLYVIAYWDSSINDYKLYYVKIRLA